MPDLQQTRKPNQGRESAFEVKMIDTNRSRLADQNVQDSIKFQSKISQINCQDKTLSQSYQLTEKLLFLPYKSGVNLDSTVPDFEDESKIEF